MSNIASSVLRAIGNTPLVQLHRVVPSGSADVLVKLESVNPTGSYKDRMALAMIEGAEARGDLRPGMRMWAEEVFGPVAGVYRAASVDEAIELANATSFGLGANAWTGDPEQQRRLIDELDAGMVVVNGMVTSYPQLPFGGVKNSGYGRELSSAGIREFCNLKSVWISDE